MRAVNLIPSDAAGGGRGGAGPWVVLGVLGLLLVGVFAYVLTNNALVERRTELASVQTQARAAQVQAEATRPYREFAALAQARVETVRQLGVTRFDWHRAFADLSRVIPEDVWLTSLLGTVTTGVNVDGGGSGTTGALRGALPNPAIELSGCTTGHDEVARLISRLRLMSGVVRVALSDSVKADVSGGGDGAGTPAAAASGECGGDGRADFPQFGVVVFFASLPQAPAPAQPGPTAAATPAATTAPPAASATPAASTTPPPTGASAAANGSDVR